MARLEDFSVGHLAATSAYLNGVLVPGRSIETTVARYTFNVFVNNNDPAFPLSLRGTGTALRFDGYELFVCTQHQLKGVDRQAVGMITDNGRTIVTSGGERHYTPSRETDAYDLVAFNFTEPVAALPNLRGRFFNFRRPDRTSGGEVVGYLLTGCPYVDQLYDVQANNHIGLARRQVLCVLDDEASADTALMRVRPREPLSFEPDGMSGGSAFVVRSYPDGFRIDFAGIIVRGGETGFHFLKAVVVHNFLRSCAWARGSIREDG